jgi:hypothetical protein
MTLGQFCSKTRSAAMILETLTCLVLVALPLSLTGWIMGQH